ncbi:zinc finger, RING/FYVE/PHD-type containing protein, partial [Tanacetum coccineum]
MDDEEYGRLVSLVEVAEAQADEEEDNESEDEDEEVEELEDMPSPRISLSCWLGADGKTHHGVMIMDDTSNDSNKPQFDDCSICYEPFTSYGKHRICCLPCGHMYGLSCIKRWLLQSSSGGGKCPQCNTLCAYKDVVLLFASPHRVSARQK